MENFYKILELSPQQALSLSIQNCLDLSNPFQKISSKKKYMQKQRVILNNIKPYIEKKSLKKCASTRQIKSKVLEQIPVKQNSCSQLNWKEKEYNCLEDIRKRQIKYQTYLVESPKFVHRIKIHQKNQHIRSPRVNFVYDNKPSLERNQGINFNAKESIIYKISPKSTFCSDFDKQVKTFRLYNEIFPEHLMQRSSFRKLEHMQNVDENFQRFKPIKMEYHSKLGALNPKLTQSKFQYSDIHYDEESEVIEHYSYLKQVQKINNVY